MKGISYIIHEIEQQQPDALMIVGPTASGKSALAIRLAEHLRGEVISADSRQIYRGMEIATGAVRKHEMHGIPHHLVSCIPPTTDYTVADFVRDAEHLIPQIQERGHVPVIAGGTGLYINSLLFGYTFAGEGNQATRERLEQQWKEQGIESLYAELCTRDPRSAAQLHEKNPRYILRALEVAIAQDAPKSALAQQQSPKRSYLVIRCMAERSMLRETIAIRHRKMFEDSPSILDELRTLLASYGQSEMNLESIGYAEALQVLHGTMDMETAIEKTVARACQYAKRQDTWFRRLARMHPTVDVDIRDLA